MNLTSITNNSGNYSQYSSPTPSSSTSQSSLFAQMLNNSGSGNSTQAPSKTSGANPNQLLSQLVPSYQSNGAQNAAQSLDPLSMF